jgi:hypothetical protein
MSRQKLRTSYQRPLHPVFVTVSLLLVFLALRVPAILATHSPRSNLREVIETAVNDSQENGSRQTFADAVCHNPLTLDLPALFRGFSCRTSRTYLFLAVEFFNARAPPVPAA